MEADYEHEEDEPHGCGHLIKRKIPEDQKRKFESYAAEILTPSVWI